MVLDRQAIHLAEPARWIGRSGDTAEGAAPEVHEEISARSAT
ncbi:hypothetical protein [Sorangium sp. So ce362]